MNKDRFKQKDKKKKEKKEPAKKKGGPIKMFQTSGTKNPPKQSAIEKFMAPKVLIDWHRTDNFPPPKKEEPDHECTPDCDICNAWQTAFPTDEDIITTIPIRKGKRLYQKKPQDEDGPKTPPFVWDIPE